MRIPSGFQAHPAARTPEVSVQRKDGVITYYLEVDDIKPEDLEVSVGPALLTVRGQSSRESTIEREGATCRSISSSRFSRQLALPDNVRWQDADAFFEGGRLGVRVPEAAPAQPRRIPVSFADGGEDVSSDGGTTDGADDDADE
ncbi:MAG: Hsp20 family protein [Actinobacteria bacterium]|nr:Hsp20 family protein [Actinomycetota bacterium]